MRARFFAGAKLPAAQAAIFFGVGRFTECYIRAIRQKNDVINPSIGFAIAGAVAQLHSYNPAAVALRGLSSALFGAASFYYFDANRYKMLDKIMSGMRE